MIGWLIPYSLTLCVSSNIETKIKISWTTLIFGTGPTPPKIDETEPTTQTYNIGENNKFLRCIAYGNPLPEVQWLIDEKVRPLKQAQKMLYSLPNLLQNVDMIVLASEQEYDREWRSEFGIQPC